MAVTVQTHRKRRNFLPISEWLPRYDRAWLRGDFIAGLTILALLIPEGMAYADMLAMAADTATINWRDVPKIAYSSSPIGAA